MAKMKTLTVSGQTYTVNDPEAVSFAQTQTLDTQQQKTARENIGACDLKQIQDALCPWFAQEGAVVTCQPARGYPLEVTADPAATRITRCGKNLFGGDAFVEAIKDKDNGGGVTVDEAGKTVTVTAALVNRTGHIFNKFKENTKYTIILYGYGVNTAGATNMRFQYADETVKHLSFDNGTGQDCPAGEPGYVIYKTVTSKVPWRLTLSNQSGSSIFFYDKCGIFEGDVSLEEFENYLGENFEKGQPVPALPGVNTLFADAGEITVSGRGDLAAEIERLKRAVLSVNEEE